MADADVAAPASWRIEPNVYSPPYKVPGVACMFLELPPDVDVGRLVGADGRAFNAITKQSGALYLWHDRDTGCVEVWGQPGPAADAMRRVQSRVQRLTSEQAAPATAP